MIPLVGTVRELEDMKAALVEVAEQVMEEAGVRVEYQVGTMIEVPRACLVADKIAKEAEFFSFGTNDLTQMTFGYSRDDAGTFLGEYLDKGILEKDPSKASTRKASVELVKSASRGDGRPGPISRWASVASTAATRRRWSSATARDSIT